MIKLDRIIDNDFAIANNFPVWNDALDINELLDMDEIHSYWGGSSKRRSQVWDLNTNFSAVVII